MLISSLSACRQEFKVDDPTMLELLGDVVDAMIESGIIDPTGNVVDISDPSSREVALD